jgi:predicted DNA-binding transcriptional regulator AlpA
VTSSDGTDDGRADPDELITFGQVRELLGVGKARAYSITRDYVFPRPWFQGDGGHVRLWRRTDVERWLDEHRRGWRDSGHPPAV